MTGSLVDVSLSHKYFFFFFFFLQLVGFQRVHLAPGETQMVNFALTNKDFQLASPATGDLYQTPGGFDIIFTNNNDLYTSTSVTLSGDNILVERFPQWP